MRKSDMVKIFAGIPTAVCLMLINESRFSLFINRKTHMLLFFTYGGIVSFDGLNLFSTLLFCVPFMVQVLLFGDDLHNDFKIASVYIFTRNDTRTKWLMKNILSLEIKSFSLYAIQFLTLVVISMIRGYKIDFTNIIIVVFLLTLSLVAMNTLWVSLISIIKIKRSDPSIVSIALALYIGWIFLLPVIKYSPDLLEIIPLTRSLLLLHKTPPFLNIFQSSIPTSLTLLSTCLLAASARIFLYFISSKWVKNTDLIQ